MTYESKSILRFIMEHGDVNNELPYAKKVLGKVEKYGISYAGYLEPGTVEAMRVYVYLNYRKNR